MDKNQEEILRNEFAKGFKEIHNKGLLAGSKAMCSVICAKAEDESKSPEERLADIIRFCKISLGENKASKTVVEVRNGESIIVKKHN